MGYLRKQKGYYRGCMITARFSGESFAGYLLLVIEVSSLRSSYQGGDGFF